MRLVVCWCLAVLGSTAWAKVYERCELAKELVDKHKVKRDQVATWVCIARHESEFNTSAIGPTGDHGIFQISELFWCEPPGWACGVSCQQLRDDNIADDWKCARRVHKAQGFSAWAVYSPHCSGMPAILSYPHLHQADDYSKLVNGLHYDPEKHSTFLDVEPTTGTPLRGSQRVQLNLMTTNTDTIRKFHHLPTTVFPIFWFEEGFELPENLLSIVRDQLIKVLNIVNIIQWTLIAVGLFMAVVGEGMSLHHLLHDLNLPKELQ